MKRSWRTPLGTLRLTGATELLEGARELCLQAASTHHTLERTRLGGRAVYLKATAMGTRTAWRLGSRALLTGALPYEREALNLRWLREHGFGAPEPLVSGRLGRAGWPRHQFLLTAAVDAPTLERVTADGEFASGGWGELGREVARLHAAGFVHRDLFARNILVESDRADREPSLARFVFLDTRRGGRALPRRGPAYDLACLLLESADADGAALLRGYESVRPVPSGIDACATALSRRATRRTRPPSST